MKQSGGNTTVVGERIKEKQQIFVYKEENLFNTHSIYLTWTIISISFDTFKKDVENELGKIRLFINLLRKGQNGLFFC
jgi:hypothetical protein